MLIKRPSATSYLLAIVMFALSVTISEIFSGKVHDLDLDLYNGPWSNVNMPIERPYM